MKRYSWTTGPVNSSEQAEEIRVTLMNDSAVMRRVDLKFYDLGYSPHRLTAERCISLKPHSSAFIVIPLRHICNWELKYVAGCAAVRATVSEDGRGCAGTVILAKDFIRE